MDVTLRVVGVGQPQAGDDAVGLEVVRFLREAGVPPHVELREITEPAELVGLWEDAASLTVVDAIVSAGRELWVDLPRAFVQASI